MRTCDRSVVSAVVVATLLALAPDAGAEVPAAAEYTLTATGLAVKTAGGARELPLPDCEPKAFQRDGARLLVACGAGGILQLDATDPANPVLRASIPTEGDAVGFHTANGKTWVEVARVEARAVDALVRAARPIEAASQPPERKPEGAAGEPAEERTSKDTRGSLIAPERRASIWELEGDARLFLPIENIGFGALTSLSAAYRFEAPVALHAELSPLGLAAAKQGTIGSVGAHAIVGLDVHLFEVGLGIGGATLNQPKGTAASSVSFAQYARLGARDGLAFTLRSNIVVDRDRFELGSLSGDGQIPLNPRWWLLVRGGGGPIGFAYGDVGVRYLVFGDLGPGSLLFTGAVGGAGLFKTRVCDPIGTCTRLSANYAGPSLEAGVEYRL